MARLAYASWGYAAGSVWLDLLELEVDALFSPGGVVLEVDLEDDLERSL